MLAEKLYKTFEDDIVPEILVIGDLMLDHYIFGSANRLSPEAPVPVVNVNKESKIVGGAANVACNLVDLGAKVFIAGVVGDDAPGKEIKTLLEKKGIDTSLIQLDPARQSTIKTRVIAGTHQVVRIDKEDVHHVDKQQEDFLFGTLQEQLAKVSIVILSDYNKGLLSPSLCRRVIEYCSEREIKVVVDPKGLDYDKYHGAFIIKPNRKELAEAAKVEKISSEIELIHAAELILQRTGVRYLVVTLSEAGIAVIEEASHELIPVTATEVYDVTGAGDTVIATLAYCLSFNFTVNEAAIVANHAASIVIKYIGSATTTIPEIVNSIKSTNHGPGRII